ncbi:MAG: putative glycosyltransferase [Parcubacteria group bacterium Gr01-1014_18]|nr:MAG: putative glycosyltransferase [Parcubacteria group bacterium Greene0416_36]TSC81425.1 MAG: putative glycosyltransferase [Parcubacteria group bacterium Gr01-1014_18]TSC99023.1 MAG: putative glycosyltransferase [Parcubacteria group bacterium Greene1014_20]TSD07296.1 MAG: putative glycosyltransferase [Parcubacteria group bacterium Greene0714_2]
MIRVFVSIVTYKSRQYIEACLESLFKQDFGRDQYRVVISDNATTDGTLEFVRARYPQVEIIENKANLGFAGGNNVVFRKAKQEKIPYVVLVNYDIVADPGWLRELIAKADSEPRAGSVQSLILLHDKPRLINSSGNRIHYLGFGYTGGYLQDKDSFGCSDSDEMANASGCAVLYRMEVLDKTGYFNPAFVAYHEDLDLGWRLRLAGYTNILAKKSIIYHKYEFGRSISKYYLMERNRWMVLLTHYDWRTLWVILPMFLAVEAGMIFFSIRNGFWRQKAKAVFYFWNPKNIFSVLADRERVQSIRKVKDREIVSIFDSEILFQGDIAQNSWVTHLGNPVLRFYWTWAKRLIIW